MADRGKVAVDEEARWKVCSNQLSARNCGGGSTMLRSELEMKGSAGGEELWLLQRKGKRNLLKVINLARRVENNFWFSPHKLVHFICR